MRLTTKDIAEFVGITVLVISILILAYELRMNRQIAINESFGDASDTSLAAYQMIINNPSIWRRGCTDEKLDDDETLIFRSMVSAVDRLFFSRYQRSALGISPATPELWSRQIAIQRLVFPGFNRHWLAIFGAQTAGDYLSSVNSLYVDLNDSWEPGQLEDTLCVTGVI